MARNALRMGQKAAAYAKRRVGRNVSRVGMCQYETRRNSGTPASGGSASTAWAYAKRSGKVTLSTNPANWAVGAPVMWVGGSAGHGHAATYAGNGKVYTTDWAYGRSYGYARVKDIGPRWNMRLVGAIEIDGNGYRIVAAQTGQPVSRKFERGMYRVEHATIKGYAWGRVLPGKSKAMKRRKKKGAKVALVRFVAADGLYWGVDKFGAYWPMRNLRKI